MEKREAGRFLCDFFSGKKTAAARLEKLSPADWEILADRALRFKVEGLFYRAIKSPDFPAQLIPDDIRKRLRKAYRDLATKNTSLFIDAAKVLRSLAEKQMPVIALKGLALVKTVYGDIALRPMHDMDLLVKEEDLVRAGRNLLDLGYQQEFPAWESMVKTYHHLPPFTNKNGTIVELHWNIVTPDSPIHVDVEGLWARACFIEVDHVVVRIFSLEDLFLHLCIHACFHLQTGIDLVPFIDLAGLMESPTENIDWQIVIQRARFWGSQKCVYLMVLLVRELLGTAPPDEILSEMKPADYQPALFAEVLEQIFGDKPSNQLIRRRVGRFSKIYNAQGINGKASALLQGVFPPKAYIAGIYPVSISSPKIYLYYLFRLGRLSFYFTKLLFRLCRHDRSITKAIDQEKRVSAISDWLFPK